MKKVLIDTNIILDIVLQRHPFFEDARQIFAKIDTGEIKGFITASSVTDIYYMSRKSCGREKTIAFIRELVATRGERCGNDRVTATLYLDNFYNLII